jgi:hypothetical protein
MRELIWFSLALLLSCLPALAVTLVKDGRPAASIVLPAKTEFDGYAEKKGFTDEEKLAAEELQLFIEKISGAKLPIVTADAKPQGATILLGAELARGQGLGAQIDKLDVGRSTPLTPSSSRWAAAGSSPGRRARSTPR